MGSGGGQHGRSKIIYPDYGYFVEIAIKVNLVSRRNQQD